MRSEFKNILIFIVCSFLLFTPYYIIRSAIVEKNFIEGVASRSEIIKPAADAFNRNESPDPEKIKMVFNEISSADRSFAAIALSDRFNRLKYLIKNDSILKSGDAVDSLINDIKEKKLANIKNDRPYVRNYPDGRGGSDKYFIVTFSSEGHKTYAIYAFKLDRRLITRLALEILLLTSISFALTGIILTILRKKGISSDIKIKTIVLGARKNRDNKSEDKHEIRHDQIHASQINENELTPIIGSNTGSNSGDVIRKNKPVTESAADTLNTVIFNFFRRIHSELKPETIALFIKKMEGRLSKTYELKEKTFLRIDSSLFDNIKITEIDNSGRTGTHIIEDGKVIRIPLIDDRSLIGLIEIRLKDTIDRLDLVQIESDTANIVREIKEYLVINNVIVDSETGFFSSSYFNMKLSEQIYSAQKINTIFNLLLIDIFHELELDEDQKNTVLKIIYPVIKKPAGEVNELFLRGGKIAMILPDKTIKEVENIEYAISKEISRFRIKLTADNIIRLRPVAAIMRSSDASDVKDILEETLKLFDTEV